MANVKEEITMGPAIQSILRKDEDVKQGEKQKENILRSFKTSSHNF